MKVEQELRTDAFGGGEVSSRTVYRLTVCRRPRPDWAATRIVQDQSEGKRRRLALRSLFLLIMPSHASAHLLVDIPQQSSPRGTHTDHSRKKSARQDVNQNGRLSELHCFYLLGRIPCESSRRTDLSGRGVQLPSSSEKNVTGRWQKRRIHLTSR